MWYREMRKKHGHWCGLQGYGLGLYDVCPACLNNELKKEGKSKKERDKVIAEAIANIR